MEYIKALENRLKAWEVFLFDVVKHMPVDNALAFLKVHEGVLTKCGNKVLENILFSLNKKLIEETDTILKEKHRELTKQQKFNNKILR